VSPGTGMEPSEKRRMSSILLELGQPLAQSLFWFSVCSGHKLKCIEPFTPHHVFFPCHHRMACLQVAEGGKWLLYVWNVVSNLMGKEPVADNLLHQIVVLLGQMGGAYQQPIYNVIEL